MDEDELLRCREFARSLNFTDSQYEEAVRRISSPLSANQILVALIGVSSGQNLIENNKTQSTDGKLAPSLSNETSREETHQTNSTNPDRRSIDSSSCYSSLCSIPSSNDNSLSSIEEAQFLKPVYIDGANVARSHYKDASFSWEGIRLSVDWFKSRGHRVKVFVPEDTCRQWPNDNIITYLNEKDALVLTPTGCNDDLFVINAARKSNAVIVSNDQYRNEKRLDEDMTRFVSSNRLPFVFVDDLFLPAEDPRGRSGPYLQEFLRVDMPSSQYQRQYLPKLKCGQRNNLGTTISRHNSAMRHPTYPNKKSLESTRSLPTDRIQSHDSSWGEFIRQDEKPPSSRQEISGSERQSLARSTSCSTRNSDVVEIVAKVSHRLGHRETRLIDVRANTKSLCRTKSHDN